MKKRIGICLLILCMSLSFLGLFAQADTTIYFTAINDTLLELSDDTMPFMESGIVYVPANTFYNNPTLKISYQYYRTTKELCVYSTDKDLYFNMSTGETYDDDGAKFASKAIYRNGQYYVPGAFVATYFGIGFSVISADLGPIVRIKNEAAVLSDRDFASSAPSFMQYRYKQYLKTLEPEETASPSSTPTVTTPPATVTPSTPTPTLGPGVSVSPQMPTYEDISVYISFDGLSETYTPEILAALDNSGYKGIFYLTAEEIAENADLLRRIIGSGHSVGIMFDESLAADYTEASSMLMAAAKIKTLFVTSGDMTEALPEDAESLGLILWGASYTVDGSADSVSPVIGNISNADNRVDLRFSTGENTTGILSDALAYLTAGKYNVRQITELDEPYNKRT